MLRRWRTAGYLVSFERIAQHQVCLVMMDRIQRLLHPVDNLQLCNDTGRELIIEFRALFLYYFGCLMLWSTRRTTSPADMPLALMTEPLVA